MKRYLSVFLCVCTDKPLDITRVVVAWYLKFLIVYQLFMILVIVYSDKPQVFDFSKHVMRYRAKLSLL